MTYTGPERRKKPRTPADVTTYIAGRLLTKLAILKRIVFSHHVDGANPVPIVPHDSRQP